MNVRVIVSVAALLFSLVGCGSSDPLPEELFQVWRNPAPGYRDTYFEVRRGSIIFGTGTYTFNSHPIRGVRSRRVGKTTEFTIEYRANDGETVLVNLLHTPGSPPRLRIGARPDQWIPEKYADWLKQENS